jgi:hypothetical protein
MTAIVNGDLAESTAVITAAATKATAATTASSSPLLPFGGRGRNGGATGQRQGAAVSGGQGAAR